jgi:outer membrane protein
MAASLSIASALPLMAQTAGGAVPAAGAATIPAGRGASSVALPAEAVGSTGGQPISLSDLDEIGPDSDAKHEQNKTLSMRQLSLHSAVMFNTVRREIGFDQPMSLEEAIKYTVRNNLAIKVSRESMNYQNNVLRANMASMLPTFGLGYNITRTDIQNQHVNSLARVQVERVSFPVFQGGSVVYGLLAQSFRARGWAHAYQASINDTLLQVYQNYNNLLLARVLLQIRAKAVEVDEEQLRVNQQLEANGAGTRFAVLQSDALLAADRQALIQQQVAVRQAALGLNYVLNYPMSVNLVPLEDAVTEQSLFETRARISEIIKVAIRRRPELREYELFKFGAARNIQVAAAPLYPQLAFYTAVSYTNTTSTSSQPSSSSSSSSRGGDTSGAGVFGGVFRTVTNGMGLTWSLNGLGLVNLANLFGAQSFNRQAGMQANQQLQTVLQQVRADYLTWRAAREQIDNAAHGAAASAEELRLASIRLREGVGTNLELIQAQRDYINALTTQAQAIVGSNLAQAQLLHDTGLISTETLLHGYRGNLN